jgi:CRP-like cAMP-binding protein
LAKTNMLSAMVRKLEARVLLDAEDRAALLALPYRAHSVRAGTYLAREGTPPEGSWLILSGFAYRHKLTQDGARQIVGVHVAGDIIDVDSSLLNVADHNIQALTACEMALIPCEALRALILSRPCAAAALWVDTLISASIFREWVLNVGRRDARTRVAHLLCEFAVRLTVAGLAEEDDYELPMTQEQLADATGLTSVHVNRTLRGLSDEGLIERSGRSFRIPSWEALRRAADFDETYLHLDQESRLARAR